MPSPTEPTPWEINWYVATADNAEEAGADHKIGDELWRIARSIGPISPNHSHWGGGYVAEQEDAEFVLEAVNNYDRLKKIEATAKTALIELDIIRRHNPGGGPNIVHIDTHNDLREALEIE